MQTILALCLATFSIQADADDAPAVWKQRKNFSDEDLRKQLLVVPEVGLNQEAAAFLYSTFKGPAGQTTPAAGRFDIGPRFLVQAAPATSSTLPWPGGQDSQLGKEAAERLHVLSNMLRENMQRATPANEVRPDAAKLEEMLAEKEDWRTSDAIPTLMQLLQAEATSLRVLLVDTLSLIKGEKASVALAQRAVFDLSPEVRKKAVHALANRPPAEFDKVLLEAFRYPWSPVADHAAEALVALRLKQVVPGLVPLLKEPDPALPYKEKNVWKIRQLVRFNHLCNCVVCHAPSTSKEDLARGLVPVPGEDPPPLYYKAATGMFVRASTTFLRQDFSVVQPVLQPAKWPTHQRYDYLLHTRPLTPAEVQIVTQRQKPGTLPTAIEQREAVLFALRELTGENPGNTPEAWATFIKAAPKEESPK